MNKAGKQLETYRGLIWTVVAIVVFAALGWLSDLYAERAKTDMVQKVTILGNRILSTERLQTMLQPYMLRHLDDIDPDSVQKQFIDHPLVKTAKVSRIFPNELQVQIREVYPIAYLQGKQYLSIDSDGRILPLPDYGMIYTLPIITGIQNGADLKPDQPVNDDYINQLLHFLIRLKQRYPELYHDISEISYSDDNGLKLITSTNSTPVYMGKYDQISQSCAILDAFIQQLEEGPVLPSYRYVDLRYANQVVVKERS